MEAALVLAKGDMRKALNLLQCTFMAYNKINSDAVFSCAGHPLRSEIEKAVFSMLNLPLSEAVAEVDELRTMKSYAVQDVLQDVHTYLADRRLSVIPIILFLAERFLKLVFVVVSLVDLPAEVRISLLEKMADIE